MEEYNIDFGELKRISQRNKTLKDEIKATLNNIRTQFFKLDHVIKRDDIIESSQEFIANLNYLIKDITLNLDEINEYLDHQIMNYAMGLEDALARLNALIEHLEEEFNVDLSNYTIESNEYSASRALENSSINGLRTSNSSINSNIDGYDTWDNVYAVYDFFKEKGFTDEQVSGIMGNIYAESRFVLDAKNSESSATGLFQWIENRYPDGWTIEEQLEHAWNEIQTGYNGKILTNLKNSTTAGEAANAFAYWFEGTNKKVNPTRVAYAEAFSDMLKASNNG